MQHSMEHNDPYIWMMSEMNVGIKFISKHCDFASGNFFFFNESQTTFITEHRMR